MSEAPPETSVTLTAELEAALTDNEARLRRNSAHQRDKRTTSMIHAKFEELDRLIGLVHRYASGDIPPQPISSPTPVPEDEDDELSISFLGLDEAVDAPETEEQGADEEAPETEVVDVPQAPDEAVDVTSPPERTETTRRAEQARLLADVQWLSRIRDREGMLVSLERLIVTGPLTDESSVFVEEKRDVLTNIYESYLGPFTKRVHRRTDHATDMPTAFLRAPQIERVMALVDDTRDVASILEASTLEALELLLLRA